MNCFTQGMLFESRLSAVFAGRTAVTTAIARAACAVGLAFFLLVLAAGPAGARHSFSTAAGKWTATDPPINLTHIDQGAINRRGAAVGYHHRWHGVDPPGAKVLRILQPPDASGVYRARVALRDPASGEWIDKRAASTFFPDAMSDAEVVAAVLAAYNNGQMRRDGEFIGRSGEGFMIEGWYHAGRIVAAYPLRGP